MANLTITVDDELLKRARIRALEQGTSVNAMLREYLQALAGADHCRRVVQDFLASARKSKCGSGKGGRKWTRDELHER